MKPTHLVMLKLSSFLLICALFLPACAPFARLQPPTPPQSPTILFSPPGPTGVPVPTEAAPLTAEPQIPVPTHGSVIEQAAVQALSSKYNIPADQIKLLTVKAMSWPTGCLGVVIPGVMCTQGPVEGFQLILEANGTRYEYHSNLDGSSVIDAAAQLSSIQFVVTDSNNQIQVVTPSFPLGPTYNPAFTGFLPAGGSVNGTAYVLDFSAGSKAVALDGAGARELGFVKNPNYSLALWRGGAGAQPKLAWGTQLLDASTLSTLQISALDGSQLETILTDEASSNRPEQLVAEFWSADGQSLYFSKEPVGIGGYILFSGASNLYSINITSKEVSALIPASERMICLDALSADFRYVADHCSNKSITIRDLQQGGSVTTTLLPPAEVTGFGVVGGARFSPTGDRVAFGLARGDPSAEQGWLAVSDLASGSSKLILTSQPGMAYILIGWLDDQTLLIQSNETNCASNCGPRLWTVGADGSNLLKVTDGNYLTVLDKR